MIKSPTDLQPTKQENLIHTRHNYSLHDVANVTTLTTTIQKLPFILKVKTKELRKLLEPIIKKRLCVSYSNGEDTTNKIIIDFEIFVRYIGLTKYQAKKRFRTYQKLITKTLN
jgi:hypothetical protein